MVHNVQLESERQPLLPKLDALDPECAGTLNHQVQLDEIWSLAFFEFEECLARHPVGGSSCRIDNVLRVELALIRKATPHLQVGLAAHLLGFQLSLVNHEALLNAWIGN